MAVVETRGSSCSRTPWSMVCLRDAGCHGSSDAGELPAAQIAGFAPGKGRRAWVFLGCLAGGGWGQRT